ncbi:hypothetical protein [Pantoea phytobeneficialis]|uniref:Uncharacterized protein n=2 Tax=Pantoea phytobeneficialis TaxID=2052056 RepID=A0ABT8XPB8_9GAMM|nr:hypothetical protein [Pantoea phytobeneficialis]MDO6405283.1 hypothetical protein [Pantoea phytobeneficialis]
MSQNKYINSRRININLNMVFVVMLVTSVIMTYLFFRSWNNASPATPEAAEYQLESFSVNTCHFEEKKITVTGWAFVPGNTKVLNRIYAKEKNGEWIELMSSTVVRKIDDSAPSIPSNHDKSGFIATRSGFLSRSSFTHDIMIISMDSKGAGHAAKYHCK